MIHLIYNNNLKSTIKSDIKANLNLYQGLSATSSLELENRDFKPKLGIEYSAL